MFLKGFKEKSNQKYLNKALSKRYINIGNEKIESLGVIVNMDDNIDLNFFKTLASKINIHPYNLKVIGFSKEKKDDLNTWDLCFYPDDFGWKDDVKSVELQSFLDKKYDALLSYYSTEDLELKLMTAFSKAQFKIGILQSDLRLNDLIIKTNLNEFKVFENEFFKYLTILNKIKNEQ